MKEGKINYHIDKVFHAERLTEAWAIWTDLTLDEMKEVQGVTRVAECVIRPDAWYVVLDPRFDEGTVLGELMELAQQKNEYFPECGCPDCKSVRASLNKPLCEVRVVINQDKSTTPKVYLRGQEVTDWIDIDEDMVLVSVTELDKVRSDMAEVIQRTWHIEDAQKAQRKIAYRTQRILNQVLKEICP